MLFDKVIKEMNDDDEFFFVVISNIFAASCLHSIGFCYQTIFDCGINFIVKQADVVVNADFNHHNLNDTLQSIKLQFRLQNHLDV
jgi:hypothetical protein